MAWMLRISLCQVIRLYQRRRNTTHLKLYSKNVISFEWDIIQIWIMEMCFKSYYFDFLGGLFISSEKASLDVLLKPSRGSRIKNYNFAMLSILSSP
jgi:hypothetical protein